MDYSNNNNAQSVTQAQSYPATFTIPNYNSGGIPVPKVPQQDTMFSLLDSLQEQAFNARENVTAVADAVDGQPLDKNPGANPIPSSALERLRMILYTLQAVNGEANRARRALGI